MSVQRAFVAHRAYPQDCALLTHLAQAGYPTRIISGDDVAEEDEISLSYCYRPLRFPIMMHTRQVGKRYQTPRQHWMGERGHVILIRHPGSAEIPPAFEAEVVQHLLNAAANWVFLPVQRAAA